MKAETTTSRAPSKLCKVLIVDDSEDFAFALSMVVENMGHQVRLAYTGADAITCTTEFSPDVVLLDIGLPDRDGYGVAAELRANHPDLNLIALTGWSREQDKKKAAAAGFDQHLTKPVNPSEIRNLFENLT